MYMYINVYNNNDDDEPNLEKKYARKVWRQKREKKHNWASLFTDLHHHHYHQHHHQSPVVFMSLTHDVYILPSIYQCGIITMMLTMVDYYYYYFFFIKCLSVQTKLEDKKEKYVPEVKRKYLGDLLDEFDERGKKKKRIFCFLFLFSWSVEWMTKKIWFGFLSKNSCFNQWKQNIFNGFES